MTPRGGPLNEQYWSDCGAFMFGVMIVFVLVGAVCAYFFGV